MQKKELDSSKIKILVCCHRPCEVPENDIFLPIQVGAAISEVNLGMQRDDQVNGKTCDNISAKNKSFCELTAVYWAWKNIKKLYPDLEYIGLNHYRRFFAFDKKKGVKNLFIRPENKAKYYSLNTQRLSRLLQKGKVVVAQKKQYPYPLFVDYSVCHVSDDLRTIKKIIEDLYPDYIEAFENVLMHNNALAPYNMTVIGWKDFEEYSQWLFDILAEAEKKIHIENYSDVQKRIWGYMAERLFNVFLYAKKKHVAEIPVVQYVDNKKQMSAIRCVCSNLKMHAAYFFIKAWKFKRK